MTTGSKTLTSNALQKDFTYVNDIFKIQYFVGPMVSYLNPCFGPFFQESGR